MFSNTWHHGAKNPYMIHQRIRFEACLFRELIKLFVLIFFFYGSRFAHLARKKKRARNFFLYFSLVYVEEQTFCRVNAGRSMTYVYGLQLYASCL